MTKINIGCGWRDFGKDWIHIDGGYYPHLDSKDVTKLDYNSNSVDLIYAYYSTLFPLTAPKEYTKENLLELAIVNSQN